MSENKYRYLFAIYSCWKNQQKAETLYQLLRGRLSSMNMFDIIIVFGKKNPSNASTSKCNFPHVIFNCGDGYEDLSEKTLHIIKLYEKFVKDEHHSNNHSFIYNGLFKCDDDILPNFAFIKKFVDNLLLKPTQYAGYRVVIQESKRLYNQKTLKYDNIPKCNYCTGPIYYLGPKAIEILSKGFDERSLFIHPAEDIMIGYNLEKHGVVATQAHLYKDDTQLFPYFNIQNIDQRHKFVFGRLHGGLGNQIFQAAATFGIARKLGMYPILMFTRDAQTYVHNPSLMEYLNGIFKNFSFLELTKQNLAAQKPLNLMSDFGDGVPPDACFSYHFQKQIDELSKNNLIGQKQQKHIFLDGYFQNEKYFVDYKKEFIQFIFDKSIFQRIRTQFPKTEQSFFIHIRRGDYVGHPLYNIRYDDYLAKSIRLICQQCENDSSLIVGGDKPHFYVVSNDVDYCRSHPILLNSREKGFEYTIVDDPSLLNSPLDTIYFMAACRLGGICANSSFSWWGSYLNDNEHKLVYFPHEWMTNIHSSIDVYYKGSRVVKV